MTIPPKSKWFIQTVLSSTLFLSFSVMAELTLTSNYALIQGSFSNMDNVFDRISDRMLDLHVWIQQYNLQQNAGLNAGDRFGILGLWVNALGSTVNQKERDDIAGYTAHNGGLAVGADWRFNDCNAFGLAVSLQKGRVEDKAVLPNDEKIRSWQATGYSWIDFSEGIYFNSILGFGFNTYHIDRTIRYNQINISSQARFNGVQFGVQGDLGWILINTNQYYVTPFARLKYQLLGFDNYDEVGAGFLSLNVDPETAHEFVGGAGVMLSKVLTIKDRLYIPQLTLFLGYDFDNNGDRSIANFIGNPVSFHIEGNKPGKAIFDVGLGIHAHNTDESIFSLKYNLQLREQYTANSGYLEYYYLWG